MMGSSPMKDKSCFEVMSMKIEHVAMYVNDLEAARDFFVTYLNGHSNGGYHNKTTNFRSILYPLMMAQG